MASPTISPHDAQVFAQCLHIGEQVVEGEVVNISPIGAMIKAPCAVEFDDKVTIEHEHAGRVDGIVARISRLQRNNQDKIR